MDVNNPKAIFDLEDYSRSFVTKSCGKFPLLVIKATDNKEVPDELKGMFTNTIESQKCIDEFLYQEELIAIKAAKVYKRKELTKRRAKYEAVKVG